MKSKKTQPTVSEEAGERVYRWTHETASEYPKPEKKDTAAAVALVEETFEPDIAVTSFRDWAEVGAWYRRLMADRAKPDAAIQAKADELTRGLTTDDAKVDALYHYVATQYRYIAVSFGIGRLQPHEAAEVFRNQYGDCKDKHTLLEAMLRAEKIEAEPVLIGSSVRVNEGLPLPSQFDHMITLVKLKSGDVWLDATPEVAPARLLLSGLRDKLALVIPPTGDAKLVRTEVTAPFPTYVHEVVTGTLDAQGELTAHFDMTMRGDDEVLYREAFRLAPRANWQQLEQQISYNRGFAGDVSAVDATLPEKTAEPFHVAWDYKRKDFGDWPNRRFPGLTPFFEAKLADDATAPKRPIALDPTGETTVTVTMTLPAGYKVTAPADVKRTTAFAEYVSTYKVSDRTLVMERTLRYKQREVALSDFAAYRDFLKAMSDDAGQMLQLVGAGVDTPKVAQGSAAEEGEISDLIRQAYTKLQAQDMNGARSLLDQAKAKDEHAKGLWVSYAAVDWADKEKAEADCRREIAEHPEDFYAYQVLNGLYFRDKKLSEAKANLEAWAKADPADPRPHTSLGGLAMTQGQYKAAETDLRQALVLSTEPDPIKVQLGRAQLKGGDTAEGKATLHALMDGSTDASILNDTAYELGDAGLDLAADEAASQKSVGILETRMAAVSLTNPEKNDYLDVLKLAAYWDTLGWIYFKEHKLQQADSDLLSAWTLTPRAEVGEHLAQVLDAEGKKAQELRICRLTLEQMGTDALPEEGEARRSSIKRMRSALETAGIKEAGAPKLGQVSSELAAMRTYTLRNPSPGKYTTADFLLQLKGEHAADVRFLKGDEALQKMQPELMAATYRTPMPEGSQAKVLRRGIVACTTGASTCMLVLLEPQDALQQQ